MGYSIASAIVYVANCGSDLIPDWGTPYVMGRPKEKKKKRHQRLERLEKQLYGKSVVYYLN